MTYIPRRVRRAARKWLLSISKVNITHKYNETERAAVMVKCSKPTQVWLPACHSNYLWVSPGKAYFQIGPMDMGLADFLTNCAILHMYPHVELGKVYSTMELHGLPQFGFQHSNTTNRIRIITKGCLDKSNVVSSVWFDFNISKRIWKKKTRWHLKLRKPFYTYTFYKRKTQTMSLGVFNWYSTSGLQ